MTRNSERRAALSRYLELYAHKLRLDLQAARLFVGSTDVGSVAEDALRWFLESNLPARYAVGVGEVIAPDGSSARRVGQTQQKDVVIYDPYGCSILGWGDSDVSLFPVESVYGVIEVKTSVGNVEQLLKGVEQALEVKRLCRSKRRGDGTSPFTGVFVFECGLGLDRAFDSLGARDPAERVDFVFVLKRAGDSPPRDETSFYLAHWHYYGRGGGRIDFVSADQVAEEWREKPHDGRDKFLTLGKSDQALLFFYLFLLQQLDGIRLARPNLWEYALAGQVELGHMRDES